MRFEQLMAELHAQGFDPKAHGKQVTTWVEVPAATRYQVVIGYYEARYVILYGPWDKQNRHGYFPVPVEDEVEVAAYVIEFINRRITFEKG